MVCPDCNTPNFSDYKFCRECGARLEAAPKPSTAGEERESQEELLVEGFLTRAFEAMDRAELDEALSNADAALAMRPESASARSVRGLIYERQGRTPEAIREFEAVVALNPRSGADRAKLDALLGSGGGVKRPRFTRGQAIGLGAAAAAVVVFAGVMILRPPGMERVGSPSERVATYIAPTPGRGVALPAPNLSRSLAAPGAGTRAAAPPAAANKPGSPVVMAPPAGPVASGPRFGPQGFIAEPGRYGLPRVVDRPAQQPAYGTPPARIGQVVPMTPGDVSGGPQSAASYGRTDISGPPSDPKAAPQPRVEPIESDTGFIRIEPIARPAAPAAPGPAGQATGTGAPPRISVGLGGGQGSAPPR